jgi:hypothetical protein
LRRSRKADGARSSGRAGGRLPFPPAVWTAAKSSRSRAESRAARAASSAPISHRDRAAARHAAKRERPVASCRGDRPRSVELWRGAGESQARSGEIGRDCLQGAGRVGGVRVEDQIEGAEHLPRCGGDRGEIAGWSGRAQGRSWRDQAEVKGAARLDRALQVRARERPKRPGDGGLAWHGQIGADRGRSAEHRGGSGEIARDRARSDEVGRDWARSGEVGGDGRGHLATSERSNCRRRPARGPACACSCGRGRAWGGAPAYGG